MLAHGCTPKSSVADAQVGHHLHVGVSTIYLYDNMSGARDIPCATCWMLSHANLCFNSLQVAQAASTACTAVCRAEPPLSETVADYIAAGSVIYTRWNKTHEYYAAEKKRNPRLAGQTKCMCGVCCELYCLMHMPHDSMLHGMRILECIAT
jgi:hypothetical protein